MNLNEMQSADMSTLYRLYELHKQDPNAEMRLGNNKDLALRILATDCSLFQPHQWKTVMFSGSLIAVRYHFANIDEVGLTERGNPIRVQTPILDYANRPVCLAACEEIERVGERTRLAENFFITIVGERQIILNPTTTNLFEHVQHHCLHIFEANHSDGFYHPNNGGK